jgi:glutathione S-transferase
MLTIYGVYRSRASRILWLAEELDIPFKLVPILQRYRLPDPPPAGVVHTRSPEFLKVNPNGHVPTIEDDGVVLHESLAITLYLAKKHGGPLAPASLTEDGEMTMWALWAATEVETNALNVLYHRTSNPKLANEAVEALRRARRRARQGRPSRWRPLHCRRHQYRRGRALRQGCFRAVRRRAAREGMARRLPGTASLPEDVGRTRQGTGLISPGEPVFQPSPDAPTD